MSVRTRQCEKCPWKKSTVAQEGVFSEHAMQILGVPVRNLSDHQIPMRELEGNHGWVTHESDVGTCNYITCNVPGHERLAGVRPTRWTLHVGSVTGWHYNSEFEFSFERDAIAAAERFGEFIEALERHHHQWGCVGSRTRAFFYTGEDTWEGEEE